MYNVHMDESKLPTNSANVLTEASYRLSLSEMRILLACLSQVDPVKEITHNTPFVLEAGALQDLMGISEQQAFAEMANAAEQFFKRYVTIEHPDPENSTLTKIRTHWVHEISYFDREARLKLFFAPKIITYISDLAKKFTNYKLTCVANMTSIYSIRLYELLIQWQSAGEREIEIDWLKRQFQIEDKYKAIKDFKKRVIEPAIGDINEHSNLWVEWGQRKCGRTVTHLQFRFGIKATENTNKKLPANNQQSPPGLGQSEQSGTLSTQ